MCRHDNKATVGLLGYCYKEGGNPQSSVSMNTTWSTGEAGANWFGPISQRHQGGPICLVRNAHDGQLVIAVFGVSL